MTPQWWVWQEIIAATEVGGLALMAVDGWLQKRARRQDKKPPYILMGNFGSAL